jgi:hypothetical protein
MTHRTLAHLFTRSALALAIAVALPGAAFASGQFVGQFCRHRRRCRCDGVPGGTATAHFDFDFGTGLTISSAVFSLAWDPSLSSAVGMSASYNGSPVDVAAALSRAGTLGALWSALDSKFDPLPPLDLSGPARLSFTHLLDGAFPVPGSTDVSLSLLLAGGAGVRVRARRRRRSAD